VSDKQLAIPGLEPPPEPAKKPKLSTSKNRDDLEKRVRCLELEVTLIRIQLEGDKDHE